MKNSEKIGSIDIKNLSFYKYNNYINNYVVEKSSTYINIEWLHISKTSAFLTRIKKMKFREANNNDWDQISEIFKYNWHQYFDFGRSLKEKFNRRSYPFCFWVIENDNGNVLGWSACFRVFESPLRESVNADLSIYVDKNSFAKGVGDLLMKETLAILKKSGLLLVFGHIEPDNFKSKKLVKKHGFSYSNIEYKNSNYYNTAELWIFEIQKI